MGQIKVLETAAAADLEPFDAIIDVRSPSEFAEDHLPGAINLPVLDDAQRAEVGTIYVQESRLRANRIGAALVARNIAGHLETALADKPADFKPLVYCWRGGQRSNSLATILSRIGWRTAVLAGGYKTYRREVRARLYDHPCPVSLVLLDGDTGSAKTEILGRLSARGVQTLDLEALAGHRGSLFGALPGQPQPSQKMFESRLLSALDHLDPGRPVLVEAESSKIGQRSLPPALWQAMQASPRIELDAPAAERALYLASAYGEAVRNQEGLEAIFAHLPIAPSPRRLAHWMNLAETGDYATLAAALIELHYDPAYRRARRKQGQPALARIALSDLGPAAQAAASDQIAAALDGFDG